MFDDGLEVAHLRLAGERCGDPVPALRVVRFCLGQRRPRHVCGDESVLRSSDEMGVLQLLGLFPCLLAPASPNGDLGENIRCADEVASLTRKELAVFTILEPMDIQKYKNLRFGQGRGGFFGGAVEKASGKHTVKVLEAGVVGSLDYKIIQASKADDLYEWLKDNRYSYSGDEATLDFYIKKAWFFTVMKIDPMQMKKKPDGSYEGEVTPTRFTFASDKLVYPLKITQISVKDKTEALFYVQAAHKVDLSGDFSYEFTWTPMWSQATGFAVPEKLTEQERDWLKHAQPTVQDDLKKVNDLRAKKHEPATLEWAKKITDKDVGLLEGKEKYNREAPKEDVDKLKLLKGHVKKGQFVTKLRKVFSKDEMSEDLEFVRAKVGNKDDNIEYVSILPTSPP